MSSPIHAFEFLARSADDAPPAVCVLFGDDRFVKRLVLDRLRASVMGADDDDWPDTSYDGSGLEWRELADQLRTVSLFGKQERRFVTVNDADKFVSACRGQLERYAAQPSATSVLVLMVTAWPSNTRLYKLVADSGLAIECGPPQRVFGKSKQLDEGRLIQWLGKRASEHHRAKLPRDAAGELLELVGPEIGMLDQHLAKLALYVDPGGTITPELVTEQVGGWRTKTTWDLLDAATDGNAAEALRQLDQILQFGEHPQALFGAMAWSLRRLADATRIVEQAERAGEPVDLPRALEKAGFRKWPKDALPRAERQLRQIGRERASQLYDWLLRCDLAMKGTHSAPARARQVIENLIIRLARQARPVAGRYHVTR